MIPKEILKKVRRIHIRTKHMVTDVFAGQYHSVFKGQGMEFQEVREYVPGDEIRWIDWNVTARMGHPFVKKFTEERELTVMLLVDVSASKAFGSMSQLKKDLAAEVAAVLAFSAVQNNDRVGLILFSDKIECFVPPRKGIAHVLRVIRETLYFRPQHLQTRISAALDFLNRIATRKTVAFLISDFITSEDLKRPVTLTARHHDLVGIVIADRLERAWPSAGLVEWMDAETGRRHLVDTSHAPTRRAYGLMQEQRRAGITSMLRSAGVDIITLEAGAPYDRELIKFFRQRERRLRT